MPTAQRPSPHFQRIRQMLDTEYHWQAAMLWRLPTRNWSMATLCHDAHATNLAVLGPYIHVDSRFAPDISSYSMSLVTFLKFISILTFSNLTSQIMRIWSVITRDERFNILSVMWHLRSCCKAFQRNTDVLNIVRTVWMIQVIWWYLLCIIFSNYLKSKSFIFNKLTVLSRIWNTSCSSASSNYYKYAQTKPLQW